MELPLAGYEKKNENIEENFEKKYIYNFEHFSHLPKILFFFLDAKFL